MKTEQRRTEGKTSLRKCAVSYQVNIPGVSYSVSIVPHDVRCEKADGVREGAQLEGRETGPLPFEEQ